MAYDFPVCKLMSASDEEFEALLERAAMAQALSGLRGAADRMAEICADTKDFLDNEIKRRRAEIVRLEAM